MSEDYDKYGRKYYLTHRVHVLENQKRRLTNSVTKAKTKRYHQDWYRLNRERIIARQLAYHFGAGYIDRKKQYDAERYCRIKARKLADNKRWRDTHIEQQNMFSRRRRIRKLFLGGEHTVEQWLYVKAVFGNTCANCGQSEALGKLHQDHKIPLAKGGTDNIDNIQPLCKSCNSSKGTGVWFAFRPVDMSWPNVKFSTFSPSLQVIQFC